MYLTEVEEKQIDLYESVFDSNLKMLENFDAITMMESVYDDVYIEGAGEMVKKVGDFFKTLLNKFKEFVESVTKAVKEKINEIKQKRIIDKIAKSGIKSIKKVKIDGIDVSSEKELKKEATEYVKLTAYYAKKLRDAKSVEEVTKISNEMDSKFSDLNEKQHGRVDKCKNIGDLDWDPTSLVAGIWIDKMMQDTTSKLMQEAEKNEFYVEKLTQDKIRIEEEERRRSEEAEMKRRAELAAKEAEKKAEECTEEIQVSKQKTNVFKRLGSKVASAFKNIQSRFSKTQMRVLKCVLAVVGTGTIYVMGNNRGFADGMSAGASLQKSFGDVTSSTANWDPSDNLKFESTAVDDIFDELCESANNEYSGYNSFDDILSDLDMDF